MARFIMRLRPYASEFKQLLGGAGVIAGTVVLNHLLDLTWWVSVGVAIVVGAYTFGRVQVKNHRAATPLLLDTGDEYRSRTFPPTWQFVSICILIAGLGISVGLALKVPPHNAMATQTEPMTSRSPQFKLLFLDSGNVFMYSPPGLRNAITGITLDAKIWNIGAPSIVSNWTITVAPADGGDPVGGQSIPIKRLMHLNGRYSTATITPSSSLAAKTEFAKVGQTPIEGTLLFYVPLSQKSVLNSKITLTAKDLYGNPYSTTVYMRDLPQR
jgi:hypothetical protein